MLYPRLTNCPECANIPELLKRIDCRLAELGNSLYNNISYMLNQPIPASDILQLIAYKRILMYKYVNPDYVYHYSISKIASKVILLTLGCESKPIYNPTVRVTTTTTTTPCPTTTTTTTSIPTTTTTTTIITVYNYDFSSGEATSELACLEIFTSDTVYSTVNVLSLGDILYNNSLLSSVKVGGNLWYKNINSSTSYQINNDGVITEIFECTP